MPLQNNKQIDNQYNNINTQKDEQTRLALLMCVPCLLITTISLFIANISAYLIAFIIIILSLFCAFIVVISKKRIEQQIRTLANIIESMISGDYTLRGRLQHNQAFQELLVLVNNLADTLSQHITEAKESRLLLDKIMQQMDAMVLAVDEQGHIVMANDSAKKLLLNGIKDISTYKRIVFAKLGVGKLISQASSGIIVFDHQQLRGEHFLFKDTFLSEGKQHYLFFITSAERLLVEKERKSWQSLLRVLSHEINNSLTPIASISQSIQKKLLDENQNLNRNSLNEGICIINERASSLNTFIESYSQLSHLPLPNKSLFELKELLSQIAKLFSDCQFQLLIEHTQIEADKNQLEQVLINIFKNASEAMEHIDTFKNSDNKKIIISGKRDDKYIHLSIFDHGMGIANSENLFVPFYSTKPQGSGIGLALCKQIIFNHRGQIKLQNRKDHHGVEVIISLPIKN